MALTYLTFVLVLSLLANIFAIYKIKSLEKTPAPTLEARDLLHDLTTKGRSALRIEVIDPENLFIVRRGK